MISLRGHVVVWSGASLPRYTVDISTKWYGLVLVKPSGKTLVVFDKEGKTHLVTESMLNGGDEEGCREVSVSERCWFCGGTGKEFYVRGAVYHDIRRDSVNYTERAVVCSDCIDEIAEGRPLGRERAEEGGRVARIHVGKDDGGTLFKEAEGVSHDISPRARGRLVRRRTPT